MLIAEKGQLVGLVPHTPSHEAWPWTEPRRMPLPSSVRIVTPVQPPRRPIPHMLQACEPNVPTPGRGFRLLGTWQAPRASKTSAARTSRCPETKTRAGRNVCSVGEQTDNSEVRNWALQRTSTMSVVTSTPRWSKVLLAGSGLKALRTPPQLQLRCPCTKRLDTVSSESQVGTEDVV